MRLCTGPYWIHSYIRLYFNNTYGKLEDSVEHDHVDCCAPAVMACNLSRGQYLNSAHPCRNEIVSCGFLPIWGKLCLSRRLHIRLYPRH
jgi:hypothetical protein